MILQISKSPLSLGMRGDDIARVQQALHTLGRDVPRGERENRVLGAGTVALLKALQADFRLSPTGVVDLETVKAINLKLASRETDQRVVRGSVRDANGQPTAKGVVQIFSQEAERERTIGKSRLSADGSYEISYRPPSGSSGRVDLRVAVLDDSGASATTIGACA